MEPSIGSALRPVAVTRLADEVVDQIRALIVKRHLPVGGRLPSERALAQTLQASRATVSQALRQLSIMGLIEIRPGSGAYVVRNPKTMVSASMHLMLDLVPASLPQLAELRAWLELAGAEQAALSVQDAALEAIRVALERLVAAHASLSMWHAADAIFHASVMKASNNVYLSALYESVHATVVSSGYPDYIELNTSAPWFTPSALQRQNELHRDIYEAIRDGDRGRVADAVVAHHRAFLEHIGLPRNDNFTAAHCGIVKRPPTQVTLVE